MQTSPRAAANNLFDNLNVAFGRWGRLQERIAYSLLDNNGKAKSREISRYCWDREPTERQKYSQRRAARSIGARPIRRKGREWIRGVTHKM